MRKRLISIIIVIITFLGTFNIGIVANAAKDDKYDKLVGDGGTATGVGLATWMMAKYVEDYPYVWGGSSFSSGGDCSGTVLAYRHDEVFSKNNRGDIMQAIPAKYQGTCTKLSDLPRIHGLVLVVWQSERTDGVSCGHVGLYLGSYVKLTKKANGAGDGGVEKNGNELDNAYEATNMVLVDLNSKFQWRHWGLLNGITYPSDKTFVRFNGQVFYYEKTQGKDYCEYVVNCTRTIDGKEYKFDANGVCQTAVDEKLIKQDSKKIGNIGDTTGSVGGGGGSTTSSDSDSENSNTESTDSTGSTDNSTDDSKYQASRLEVSSYELDFEQEKRVDEINKDRDRREDEARWQWVYIILSLSGILILVYTLLLVIVYYIDLFNSVTEVSLLHKLTFGHMYPVGSKDNLEHLRIENTKDGPTYATHVTIWRTFVFGVLASAFLMNMRTVVILFLELTTWFSNLISSMGSG